jgi:hypothetical protein
MIIKAIETHYNGYRFRSRLEARWAIFFDAMGIKWEYELQGFVLGDGTPYLPDFYLPELASALPLDLIPLGMYAEVKAPGVAFDKAERFACDGRMPVLLLDGTPDLRSYGYWTNREKVKPKPGATITCLSCSLSNHRQCAADPCLYGSNSMRLALGTFYLDQGEWHNYFLFETTPHNDGPVDVKTEARMRVAVKAARQARFEHGETPCRIG